MYGWGLPCRRCTSWRKLPAIDHLEGEGTRWSGVRGRGAVEGGCRKLRRIVIPFSDENQKYGKDKDGIYRLSVPSQQDSPPGLRYAFLIVLFRPKRRSLQLPGGV